MIGSVADRFWAKVEIGSSDVCWPWLAYKSADGYGRFNAQSRTPVNAHRIAYELKVGPIPAGLQLDHLCRNRDCCNPAHLEAVTNRTNVLRGVSTPAQRARQTECKRGHPLSGDNLHIDARGLRRCKACQNLWWHEHGLEGRRAAAYLRESLPQPQDET